MIVCRGCGRVFKAGEPMYEIECAHFYCTTCCLPGVAGEFPIVGEQVLTRTGSGYDSTG